MNPQHVELSIAIVNKQAVSIEYKSPYTSVQVLFGVPIYLDEQKCRLAFYQRKTLLPFIDDFNSPQTITIQLSHIQNISRLPQYTYQPEVALIENISTKILKNLKKLDFSLVLEQSLLGDYKTLNFQKLDLDDLHDQIPYETIFMVTDGEKSAPLISWRLAYNLETNEYQKVEKEWNPLIRLKEYFKALPLIDIQEIDRRFLERYLKEGYTIIEDQQSFFLKFKTSRKEKQRLSRFKKNPLNRPMKAYLNQLTPRNLGRKAYYLPYLESNLRVQENLASFTSLKHPITLIDIDQFSDVKRLFEQLIITSLLNQTEVLIVDPQNRVDEDINHVVLDLRSKEQVFKMFKTIKEHINKDVKTVQQSIPAYDYDEIYYRLKVMNHNFHQIMTLSDYHYDLNKLNDFHLSVSFDMHLTSLIQQTSKFDIDWLKDSIIRDNTLTEHLDVHYHRAVQLLHQANYQKYAALMSIEDPQELYTKVLRIMKTRSGFNQLKNLFKVMIVNDNDQILYKANSFERLILVHPEAEHLKDLIYADKLTIIDESIRRFNKPYQIKPQLPLPHIHAKYYHHPYQIFNSLSENIVKKHSFRKIGLGYHHLVAVENHREEEKHLSKQEVKTILNKLPYYHPGKVQLITPFNRQKRYFIQANEIVKKHYLSTFYEPLKYPFVLISLTLHERMSQESYDWIKNHPELLRLIKQFDSVNLTVFSDLRALFMHADNNDLLAELITTLYNKQVQAIDSINTFYALFKSALIKGYRFKQYTVSSLDKLRLPKDITFIDSFRVIELDQTFVIIEFPLHWTEKNLQRLENRMRQDGYTLMTLNLSNLESFMIWQGFMIKAGLINRA